jgi:hypothetical protein
MRTIHVKSGTGEELVIIRLDDSEGADVFAYFRIRMMEKRSVVRKIIHQTIDAIGVL